MATVAHRFRTDRLLPGLLKFRHHRSTTTLDYLTTCLKNSVFGVRRTHLHCHKSTTTNNSYSKPTSIGTCKRNLATRSEPSQNVTTTDALKLSQTDLSLTLSEEIKKELRAEDDELRSIAHYYFDGKGKAVRPTIVLLMGGACNFHNNAESQGVMSDSSQYKIAMITEMIHTASLIHDDVIDAATTRRGKPAINQIWGQRKAVLAGNYVLSLSSVVLARVGNAEVVKTLSQTIEDLIRGEFMQLGSKEDQKERFSHYLEKTYKKTASLLANSCKAVALLGGCEAAEVNLAYQYGRHVGMAFQLVDDLLDFVSAEAVLGKPVGADLHLGLATAPVLFASQRHPELNAMIMRRFSEPGDVEAACRAVKESNGLEDTKILAQHFCKEAIRYIEMLRESAPQQELVKLTQKLLNRKH